MLFASQRRVEKVSEVSVEGYGAYVYGAWCQDRVSSKVCSSACVQSDV